MKPETKNMYALLVNPSAKSSMDKYCNCTYFVHITNKIYSMVFVLGHLGGCSNNCLQNYARGI